ncbi:MAG TPA: protein translocase subunit SecD [Vicinamibacterales bacterium]|nr:protein translocase subunit SecD [Vicinamibacterales bacterium]
MYKNLRWKLIVIVAVTALGLWSFVPPSQKVKLGLDLQGGVHLVMRVHTDDALKLETETTAEQLRVALGDAGITVESRPTSITDFTVTGVPADKDAQFRTLADSQVGLVYDREAQGGGAYVFRMRPNLQVQNRIEAVNQALQTIDRRMNEYGVAEPIIQTYGNNNDQIVVELPGVTDVARVQELIRSSAKLELKLVVAGPAPDEATLLSSYGGKVPDDMLVVPDGSGTSSGFYLVNRVAAVTGNDLRTARPTTDELNQPAVSFTLNSQGVEKFSRVTAANVGKQLAIVLDNRVRSAPVIEGPIPSAEARITGRFTQKEVQDLSLVLRSGALPASLTVQERREIGPALGEDSIRAGILASIGGLALVTLFMFIYYRGAGFNAVLSIALNLIILLGIMAYLGAAMTLPGIAGFILTIGMGVDSNVLIFERIREELATKKGARQAVAAGFDRVFITIVDTHVSSLIAAAFLFQFGTGPIRGFATTLVFGLLANVFTAVFVSRTLFEFILSRKPAGAAQLSI